MAAVCICGWVGVGRGGVSYAVLLTSTAPQLPQKRSPGLYGLPQLPQKRPLAFGGAPPAAGERALCGRAERALGGLAPFLGAGIASLTPEKSPTDW